MSWIVIALAAAAMLLLAIVMTVVLGWANQALKVEVDPRIEAVDEALPGANCGACGYVGCREYAEAVVADTEVPCDLCPVGGTSCAEKVARILGRSVEQKWPYRPAVHCAADRTQKLKQHPYNGEPTCAAANLVAGVQGCTYGCLGLGDCERACAFDAIHIVDGKVVVDYDKCTGCKACATVCPRNVISMVPFKDEEMYVVACSNKDFGKDVKAVCEIGCIGCKACTRLAEGLFNVKDNVASIDYEDYDPAEVEKMMGDVLKKCPMKGIIKIGTPSEEDLAKVKSEQMPGEVRANFETTVDRTDWQG
jgi:RnfABCDGE-type electron transport complex B subunit